MVRGRSRSRYRADLASIARVTRAPMCAVQVIIGVGPPTAAETRTERAFVPRVSHRSPERRRGRGGGARADRAGIEGTLRDAPAIRGQEDRARHGLVSVRLEHLEPVRGRAPSAIAVMRSTSRRAEIDLLDEHLRRKRWIHHLSDEPDARDRRGPVDGARQRCGRRDDLRALHERGAVDRRVEVHDDARPRGRVRVA